MIGWAEKYRPKTLDEIVGNPTAVAELRKWAAAWDKVGRTSARSSFRATPHWEDERRARARERNEVERDRDERFGEPERRGDPEDRDAGASCRPSRRRANSFVPRRVVAS